VSLPARCPAHPEAHVIHRWVTHRMEFAPSANAVCAPVGPEWTEAHEWRCAVVGCQQRLMRPPGSYML